MVGRRRNRVLEEDDGDERAGECWKECKREGKLNHRIGYLGVAVRIRNGKRSCRKSRVVVGSTRAVLVVAGGRVGGEGVETEQRTARSGGGI